MKKYYIAYTGLFIELIADKALAKFLSAVFGDNLLSSEPSSQIKIASWQLKNVGEEWQVLGSDREEAIDGDQLVRALVKEVERCFAQNYDKNALLRAGVVTLKSAAIIVPVTQKKKIRSFCDYLGNTGMTRLGGVAVAFSENSEQVDVLFSPDKDKAQLPPIWEEEDVAALKKEVPSNGEGGIERLANSQGACLPKLFVFPNNTNDEEFSIEPLSRAQVLLELTACVLNGEKLPATGFRHLSNLARDIPAIKVNYGNFAQIDGFFTELVELIACQGILPAQLAQVFKGLSGVRKGQDVDSASAAALKAAQLSDVVPAATPITSAHKNKKLTIAMATYDDYDGVYFTVQSLRLFHPEICDDLEIIILDNNPTGKCAKPLKNLSNHISNLRYVPELSRSGTAVRDIVFKEASSDYVLCMDCHVMIAPGAVAKLIAYYEANPDCPDLLQGPMLGDNLKSLSTHFTEKWNKGMYGVWGYDERAQDPDAEPFDIPMQGLGLFSCKKSAWPGFNADFRGFGGEEGYIHEKIRQAGGRALCVPFLRWLHRFDRPLGVPYSIDWKDRVINYLIGFSELGLDVAEVRQHFTELLNQKVVEECVAEVALLESKR